MKIILAGTPEFSIKSFEQIINNFDVVAIVTQPDRKSGRGQRVIESPVKQLAKKYNIKIYQPNRIKDIYEELKKIDFDIFLTCAFGQLIPDNILNLPKKAALNIHASLLPKYRGAAPIHYAVLNGDKETGISLMYMIKAMDAGDVLFTSKVKINENETTGDLFNKLSISASKNIINWLRKIEINDFKAIKQDKEKVSLSPKITKAECQITNHDSLFIAKRKIKAFNPFPGAFVLINDIKYKVHDYGKQGIPFVLKDGTLYISNIQAPNKKAMSYQDFLKGNKL